MFSTKALLHLWERGLVEHPLQRALDLLRLIYPELSLEQLSCISIGQRDLGLLTIREALFGQRLDCLTNCPACNERLELEMDTAQFHVSHLGFKPGETYSVTSGDCEVEFRLPTSRDLFQIADLSDESQARHRLFEICVQQARSKGVAVPATELPKEIIRVTADRMAELDPQADLEILLNCPACSQQWSTNFNIASFLWMEINAWAIRMLHEIHSLASAYGWREDDILALSTTRRQIYLELIG